MEIDTLIPEGNERIAVIAHNFREYNYFVIKLCDYANVDLRKNFFKLNSVEQLSGRGINFKIIRLNDATCEDHRVSGRINYVVENRGVKIIEVNDRELFK